MMIQTNTIYTLGYQRWTLQALQATCADLGAALLDIRYSPRSSRPEWAGSALARQLGHVYTHVAALGNRNYKGGGDIELVAPEKTLPFVRNMLVSQPVILLCVCADVTICHRAVAAAWLSEQLGNPVVHLDPPSRQRATELPALTFASSITRDYWRAEAQIGCAASLNRLRDICAAQGVDYAATVRGLL